MPLSGDVASGSPLLKGYPEVDQPSCQLLGRTALIVQGLMGLFVILSLVYKRHRESPKRPWRIWLFDVSKQVVGQLFVHSFNVLVSDLTSNETFSNACVSYFLHILIDTTFGIFMIYVTLHALTRLFTEKLNMKGFESGVYGNPPSFKFWARQAALYVLSLTTMKAVVVTFLYLFPQVYLVGEWLLGWTWTGGGDGLQVVFVMGIFPIIMNVLQFWLIDTIVKAAVPQNEPPDLEQGGYQDREPLFQAPDDDDHSDTAPSPRQYRSSLSSLDSRGLRSNDNLSLHDAATSPEEVKSSASSSKKVTITVEAVHEYPPSLSSSFSSVASSTPGSKSPREAKNLLKKTKRRDPSTPIRQQQNDGSSISRAGSSSPAPIEPAPKITEDQAEWDGVWDDTNDWAQQTNTNATTQAITKDRIS
ncbi:hypothetical protein D9613_004975 [Agrocybe pediades]|uniref:Vacuolar membrane protein n=1 Tax=Agrocybe pediades TaxID=84607 RepID=A0A8H4QYW6_9AGAR|nr:hypothetical protein D9613_004975 [Agrocybe pediades]